MSLLDQARIDARSISIGPFSQTVNFVSTDGSVNVNINALGNKIGRKVDSGTGVVVNSKNASVVPHEDELASVGFPVRNSVGEVSMVGVRVNTKDSSGRLCNYIVLEDIPDESIGLITLMLGDFES